MNHFLRADTAAELQSALDAAGLYIEDEDGNRSYYGQSGDYAVDWIGTIYEPTGVMLADDEGNEYPEMAAVPGAHCNIYGPEIPESLHAYRLDPAPNSPHRVPAGGRP